MLLVMSSRTSNAVSDRSPTLRTALTEILARSANMLAADAGGLRESGSFTSAWAVHPADRVGPAASGQGLDDLAGAACPVDADQDRLAAGVAGDLRERLTDDEQVFGRGVRPRVPRPQQHRDRSAGAGRDVVKERAQRIEPEPALCVAAGCYFSLCAVTSIGSRSMTSGG